jgi:hypothetical protein
LLFWQFALSEAQGKLDKRPANICIFQTAASLGEHRPCVSLMIFLGFELFAADIDR